MGFDGACSGQTCSFTIGGDASVSARFETDVVQLASATELTFGINSTDVFYWNYVNGSSGLWAVAKAGGAPRRVSESCCSFSYIVADDAYVYWTDLDNIYRAPAGGGPRQRLYSGYLIASFALDGNTLYWPTSPHWLDNNTHQSGGIHAGAADGTREVWLSTNAVPSGSVDFDAQYIYWTDADAHGIGRIPKQGGAEAWPIRCGDCLPGVVRVDFDNIYYRNDDGDTWAFSKATSAFTQLNTGEPRNNLVYRPLDLDVNARVAYWTWHDGTGSNMQGLFRANADGSGWTPIESGYDREYHGVRVDDKYVFYTHHGVIYRRFK